MTASEKEKVTLTISAETIDTGMQIRMLAKSASATKLSLHQKRHGIDRDKLKKEEDQEAEKKWKTKAS